MNWFCNTFVPCDKTKETITLGDIVPSEGFVSSHIDFLQPNGAVKTVNHASLGTVKEKYIYWVEDDEPAQGAGWYFEDDEDGLYNQNARVIKFGESYCVVCAAGESGESLTFSGEVAKDSTTLEIGSQMNWMGNCAPADIKLGDIVISEGFVSSHIDFLQPNGAVKTVNHASLGTVKEKYIYWVEDDEPAQGAGWYFEDDEDGLYNQNARVVTAGEGVCVVCAAGESGEKVSFPSALK